MIYCMHAVAFIIRIRPWWPYDSVWPTCHQYSHCPLIALHRNASVAFEEAPSCVLSSNARDDEAMKDRPMGEISCELNGLALNMDDFLLCAHAFSPAVKRIEWLPPLAIIPDSSLQSIGALLAQIGRIARHTLPYAVPDRVCRPLWALLVPSIAHGQGSVIPMSRFRGAGKGNNGDNGHFPLLTVILVPEL